MKLTLTINEVVTTIEAQPGDTILQALGTHSQLHAPCGGTGKCKKCTVYLKTAEGELPCLACQTPVKDGMVLRLPHRPPQAIATGEAAKGTGALSGFGIACDIGTTTVVCHLIDRATGRILATTAGENRQKSFGADVISRIKAAEGTPELTHCIRQQLSEMIMAVCTGHSSPKEIRAMAVAGNPTMCHLLTGLDPTPLGKAPYQPVDYFGKWYPAEQLSLPIGGMVYLLPAVSGFVGGDVLGDALSLSLNQQEKPSLLIDVGTNGEILLGCKDRFLCCSTAAGPAFEGAEIHCGMQATAGAIYEVHWKHGYLQYKTYENVPPVGICGSGLLDAVAALLDAGAIDKTGRMLDADQDMIPEALEPYLYLEHGEPAFSFSDDVYLTQSDVRKLQLAKAAIAAGVEVLCREAGNPEIETLFLAGGFPIPLDSAARIGLIPGALTPSARSVGNGAVRGAIALLCDETAQERLEALRRSIHPIELSGSDAFQDAYIRHMSF